MCSSYNIQQQVFYFYFLASRPFLKQIHARRASNSEYIEPRPPIVRSEDIVLSGESVANDRSTVGLPKADISILFCPHAGVGQWVMGGEDGNVQTISVGSKIATFCA